jgi:3-oxoacyl-[acyl-carrier-protein] synthase II
MHATRGAACITGVGCVTNAGFGFAPAWRNVCTAERVVRSHPGDGEGSPARTTTMAPPTEELMERRPATGYPRPLRATLLAAIAAGEAWAAAGPPQADPDRAGLLVSRCFPEHDVAADYYRTLHARGPGAVSGLQFVQALANTLVGYVALDMKLRGPCFLQYGSPALGHALDALREGQADVIVAGGVDQLSDFALSLCASSGFLDGSTWLPGDGAAFLVLERHEFAAARYAPVFASLQGAATVTDRAGPLSRTPEDITICIERALDDAQVSPSDVALVSGAAGGLVDGREVEAEALRCVLSHEPPVLRTKEIFGETWGAGGVLATAAAAAALAEGVAPSAGTTLRGTVALVISFDLPGQTSAFVVSAP